MKDYRKIIERVYAIRGRFSSKEWLHRITAIEIDTNDINYSELQAYEAFLKLKHFIISSNKAVSHKQIRPIIKNILLDYDEDYIGKIGQVFTIIEHYSNFEKKCTDCELVDEIRKCFPE